MWQVLLEMSLTFICPSYGTLMSSPWLLPGSKSSLGPGACGLPLFLLVLSFSLPLPTFSFLTHPFFPLSSPLTCNSSPCLSLSTYCPFSPPFFPLPFLSSSNPPSSLLYPSHSSALKKLLFLLVSPTFLLSS